METALTETGRSKTIGDLLRQQPTWGLIEDMVKGGYDSLQIARMLMQSGEFPEIDEACKGNKSPLDTLARAVRYHVQQHLPIASRVGVVKLRQYVDREIGLDVLKELKSVLIVQKERVGRAVAWENKLDIPNGASGKEVERLVKGLGVLGQLLLAAGMSLHEEKTQDIIDVAATDQTGLFTELMSELKKNGMDDKKAIEAATSTPAL